MTAEVTAFLGQLSTKLTLIFYNNQYAARKNSENRWQTGIEQASLGIRPTALITKL